LQGGAVSPDGRRLAAGWSDGTVTVWDLQTGTVEGEFAAHSDRCFGLAFSPDGSQIIYASEPGPQLYVIPVGGGSPRRVSPSGFSTYCAEPDWSRADPNKIVFTFRSGGSYRIAVLNLATGQAKEVPMQNAPFDAKEPSWLADGRHVIYTAMARSGDCRLCILDTETGKSTPVSPVGLGSTKQASVVYGR
jgi:TolB protein